MTESHGTDVLIDVTSLISAEDYLVSQNRHARPGDPFAQQCFVEIIQSLIFMSHVYVSHPLLVNPEPEDFGQRPLLLQSLMAANLLSPLQLGSTQQARAHALERRAIRDLQSANGIKSMARFVDQAFSIDQSTVGRQNGLSERLRAWGAFQHSEVKVATGHRRDRIPTRDGVEDDEFGQWSRAAALLLAGALDTIAEPEDGPYVMATLARGVKYRARAEATRVAYQSHPLRRDFSLTFDLTRRGATDTAVLDLIRAVRGIHESLADAAGVEETHKLVLVQFQGVQAVLRLTQLVNEVGQSHVRRGRNPFSGDPQRQRQIVTTTSQLRSGAGLPLHPRLTDDRGEQSDRFACRKHLEPDPGRPVASHEARHAAAAGYHDRARR